MSAKVSDKTIDESSVQLLYLYSIVGDLPDGVMAFSKLLKYKTDWQNLANNLKSRDYKISEEEVIGTKLFLKQLANEYNDMEFLSKAITDAEKVKQAKAIAKDFRIKVRECDDAASAGNLAKVGENYPITASELDQFFDLLKDVPDEL